MSKVKFIQWGTPKSPKTIEQYNDDFVSVREQYPGGVIFVTYYTDEKKTKTKQEIWANSVQYSVGGGGGDVIYGTDMIDASGRTYKWQVDENGDFVRDEDEQLIPEYTGITGSEGSIYVYTGTKTQTAYYWVTTDNDGKWEPFNVDANNIWITSQVTMAGNYTQVGNLSKDKDGSKSLNNEVTGTENKDPFTLQTLINKIFTEELADTSDWAYYFTASIGAPTLTASLKGGKFDSTKKTAVVGSKITITSTTPTSTASQYAKVHPVYGYYTSEDDKNLQTEEYTVTATPGNANNATSVSGTGDKTVASGKNTWTVTVTGDTYSLNTTATDPGITPVNNVGKKQTTLTLDTETWGSASPTKNPPTNFSSITYTGVYEVFFNGESLYPTWHSGNINSVTVANTPFVKPANYGQCTIEAPKTCGGKIEIEALGNFMSGTYEQREEVTINGAAYYKFTLSADLGDGAKWRIVN